MLSTNRSQGKLRKLWGEQFLSQTWEGQQTRRRRNSQLGDVKVWPETMWEAVTGDLLIRSQGLYFMGLSELMIDSSGIRVARRKVVWCLTDVEFTCFQQIVTWALLICFKYFCWWRVWLCRRNPTKAERLLVLCFMVSISVRIYCVKDFAHKRQAYPCRSISCKCLWKKKNKFGGSRLFCTGLLSLVHL